MIDDFVKNDDVEKSIISKYQNWLPNSLLDIWKSFGYGIFYSGFFKIINPDDYVSFVEKSYFRGKNAIPFMITALGDIIVWEKNEFVTVVRYRNGTFQIIASGCDFFFDDILEEDFDEQYFSINLYRKAITKMSVPAFSECLGFEPLLVLGGREVVENLKTLDLKTYLEIIFQSAGKIGV